MKNSVNALPAIVLSDISKQFGTGESQVSALKGVNLEIAKGEFIALCGPSGSGKSTLLNILSGIDRPSAGQVIFLNHLLNALPEKEMAAIRGQHLGFIFQFFNLIPVLDVLDNIFYPLVLNGYCDKKEAKARALHALDSVGLAQFARRKPGQLSGGQQQRVAIARALAHQPCVVVADEPTGNLDLVTGEAIMDLLLKINQQTQTTFIISTHSTQLKDRAKRVIEITDGELTYDSAR
ncbi:ABC transporter ATP-binding protein [Kosakonia cowanii]|uniref:ABC transporter ATP-binding protein n=1 Tax=Kosakonia cowanii TaxID=208223 RepID=UPI0011217119|nr:ABC transporter ATP-binding protein [Kosakonia cowanii]MDP9768227.1 putative ABC transport system ATP-binding protein [Atlantibacter hermannii]TPD69454.1 ABC transporter ATP-binding protein [Kosakonia cowanii]TPD92490.1 ABC transporter ATP-binding protein [Kosakonia cowanii]TPE08839.1 ABC transporter ATP-binding protein [Kosakonia cowanii]